MAPASPVVTIYHNPACGTSRTTLALIRAAGIEPVIVEYLKTPPDRQLLTTLLQKMAIRPRELLRAKEALCGELGLADPGVTDEVLLGQMLAHPVLINRPIVVTERGARLCRPPERVQEILPAV